MRHDPAAAAVIIMRRSLKMYGMAQAVTDLTEQSAPAFDSAVPILSQLLKAKMAEREVRSIAYQMKAARFPAYKDLSGSDFMASEINEATLRQLHKCEFLDGAQNVCADRWSGHRGPVPVSFRSFESNTRHQGDRIWQRRRCCTTDA